MAIYWLLLNPRTAPLGSQDALRYRQTLTCAGLALAWRPRKILTSTPN
jgi:hypothetical protein